MSWSHYSVYLMEIFMMFPSFRLQVRYEAVGSTGNRWCKPVTTVLNKDV